jgi:sugar phosphate isomerase/epimerase
VEPARVEEELPRLVEALKKVGCSLTILTSGITEASTAQHTEKVLRTAKALGVKRYRMGFCKYDLKQPILPQLDAWSAKFKTLIALSKEIGMQPLFQNHSGKEYLGAPVWDVFSIMKDYPAKDWAFAFDIMHATVEGSLSWPLEVNLVRDHIGVAYFKDFKWGDKKFTTCPLGEGVVSKDYVGMLKKSGYGGPVSLHVEYLDHRMKEPTYLAEALKATQRDFAVLKDWWK